MEWKEYRRRWFKRAVKGRLGQAELVCGVIAIILAPIAAQAEEIGAYVAWGLLAVFMGLFGILLLIGFTRAPFWMANEDEQERAKLAARIAELVAQLDDQERRKIWLEGLVDLRDEGVRIRNHGIQSLAKSGIPTFVDRVIQWEKDVISKLKEFSTIDAKLFGTLDRYSPEDLMGRYMSGDHRKHFREHNERLNRFMKIIDDHKERL